MLMRLLLLAVLTTVAAWATSAVDIEVAPGINDPDADFDLADMLPESFADSERVVAPLTTAAEPRIEADPVSRNRMLVLRDTPRPGSYVSGPSHVKYQLVALLGKLGSDRPECADTKHPTGALQTTIQSLATRPSLQRYLPAPRGRLLTPSKALQRRKSTEIQSANAQKSRFILSEKYDSGSCGEVWRATVIDSDSTPQSFILKRIFVERGAHIHLSGLREVHFGMKLASSSHVARFVEHFETLRTSQDSDDNARTNSPRRELWLVFRDEGVSLKRYLYTRVASRGSVVVVPSEFWHRLRMDQRAEQKVMRQILLQILNGVHEIHSSNTTHRDLKPSNIIVRRGSVASSSADTILRIADFGSAVDDEVLTHLYGSLGPTVAENTMRYAPPEVRLPALAAEAAESFEKRAAAKLDAPDHWHLSTVPPFSPSSPESYDMWSVGVIWLEMILASDAPFEIAPRRRARLLHELRGRPDATVEHAALLEGLAEFCIAPPKATSHVQARDESLQTTNDAAACTDAHFLRALEKRDPLGQTIWGGPSSAAALDLLRHLLRWDPSERISAEQALAHPYFEFS